MNNFWKNCRTNSSPVMRGIQGALLILIIIGLGLFVSQKIWLPVLVDYIIEPEEVTIIPFVPHKKVTTPSPAQLPVVETVMVEGFVTIGPVCPMVSNPPDPSCADKPYKTTLVLVTNIIGRNGGVLIQTDEQGHFSLNLLPGSYTVRSQSSSVLPRIEPVTFQVEKSKKVILNLIFDSGIR